MLGGLGLLSLLIGSSGASWRALVSDDPDLASQARIVLLESRLPRTLSLVLAGSALGVAGLIMQALARNRFTEPSTAGTTESAGLGMLAATLLAPGLPVVGKMLVSTVFALVGTLLFLQILRHIRLQSILIVPLIGIMLGSVIDSVNSFLAYRFDLLQSLGAWSNGDFSAVLEGRYELLWIGLALTVAAYLLAARLTVAGMGEAFSRNLGLHYHRVMALGLGMVAMITAIVVSTVGMVPFLGLIVPNLVSAVLGDNARRTMPWVAVTGAVFVLACDVIGRTIRYPYEIPAGTVAGVLGCALFLFLLLRSGARHG
ncbi:ABC transporter permease [Massilia sp. BSC265]|uniref:ABC transporter permease n=1 Tax=Massilia sp. BSC265 TaxID=1549812 RepID=UPI0004E8EF5A|nr:iron ABC transporter permease [Massilia sp. BSC265]